MSSSWGKSWGKSWGNIGLVPDTTYVLNSTRVTSEYFVNRFCDSSTKSRYSGIDYSPNIQSINNVQSINLLGFDSRFFNISKDNNPSDIKSEQRIFQIDSDDNIFNILYETRSIEIEFHKRISYPIPTIEETI